MDINHAKPYLRDKKALSEVGIKYPKWRAKYQGLNTKKYKLMFIAYCKTQGYLEIALLKVGFRGKQTFVFWFSQHD